jgi:hypothetical protein
MMEAFNVGDIIQYEGSTLYGIIVKQAVTNRMVYIEWFHDDTQGSGWFPTNIIVKVS